MMMNSPTPPRPHPPIPTQIVIDDDIPPSESSLPRPSPSSQQQQAPAVIIPRNLPLVDEIDLRQCFTFDKLPSPSSIEGMVIGKEELNVICGRATQSFDDAARHTYCSDHGGTNNNNRSSGNNVSPVRKAEFKACPCCRRYIENFEPVSPGSVETSSTIEQQKVQQQQKGQQQQPLQERDGAPPQKNNSSEDNMDVDDEDNNDDNEEYGSWNLQRSMLTSTMGSSLLSLFNGGIEDWNTHQEEEFHMAAPPLVQGDKIQHYTVTETIVQGWLYKKGSGNDIWGRRWWKPRWVTLALAVHTGQAVPMPLIISHHAPGVPFPAHVMELNESTVIMAIERTTTTQTPTKDADGEDIEEWNRHCFQIVNSRTNETRIFTAPLQERNEWAFVINEELYAMEERLKRDRAKKEIGRYTKAQREERKARRLGMDVLLNEVKKEEDEQRDVRRPLSPARRRSIGLPPRVSPPRDDVSILS
mmetsp:Transcript_26600/g.43202  ORF Transcript_26600/g.43202 Transcript_26600/m.43202 type:complete len:472 (+) Transcript_26600:137-1552(+)